MSYSLKEAFKDLKTIKEDNGSGRITTIAAAKKAGYTEITRYNWRDLEYNVPAKYFKVQLGQPAYGDGYTVQIRSNYASNPTTGQRIVVTEYKAVWPTNSYRGNGYAYKHIKPEQVDLTQFRRDRDNAAREKEIAEYTEKLNNFNVNRYINMEDVEKALDEIAKHIDIEPSVRESILNRAKKAIGGPKDWCTVVVLTDRYAYFNPKSHSKISRTGMSKEDAYYDAYYSNEPVYQQLNASAAWHYDYMKTEDANEFLAKQIQREDDIHSGKIKVDLN